MAMLAKVYNIPNLKRSGARRKSLPCMLKDVPYRGKNSPYQSLEKWYYIASMLGQTETRKKALNMSALLFSVHRQHLFRSQSIRVKGGRLQGKITPNYELPSLADRGTKTKSPAL